MGFLLFEIHGYQGDFGINPIPMIDLGETCEQNAFGESLEDLHDGFSYSTLLHVEPERKDVFSELARKIIVSWFSLQFRNAGGDSVPYKCYLMWHDDGIAFHLNDQVWVDTIELL
jgi:hypothetical protein